MRMTKTVIVICTVGVTILTILKNWNKEDIKNLKESCSDREVATQINCYNPDTRASASDIKIEMIRTKRNMNIVRLKEAVKHIDNKTHFTQKQKNEGKVCDILIEKIGNQLPNRHDCFFL